jgi:hypothetical protein
MSNTSDKKNFLDVCRGIEGLCADLYHYYSELYEDIPEAAHLWKKTALEEENHQRQFELAIKLWDDTEFEIVDDNLERAFAIQYKLLNLLDHIKISKPDLLVAVSKAVEMEEKLADLHIHTSLKFKDESMQKMFSALSEADREHVADLRRYRSILYLPLSEMEGDYN